MDRRRFLLAGLAALAGCAAIDDRAGRGDAPASPVPDGASAPAPAPSAPTTGGPTTGAPAASMTPTSDLPPSAARPAGTARFVTSGPRAGDQVALTFHTNGEPAVVDQLLTVLRDRRVPVTAFVVGNWLEANPAYAERLRADGHELANHTYTHPTLAQLPRARIDDEIGRCAAVLTRLGGSPGRWFRPSGTDDGMQEPPSTIMAAAAGAGYGSVAGFDVDPLDYRDPPPATIVARTAAALAPGAIVSLHMGHRNTVAALPGVLDELATRRLVPVTLSTLVPG